jgi:outer membrane protein assembly factor BamE
MRTLLYSLLAFSFTTLSACSTVLDNLPGIYTLEIQQGNMVDQEMINQLRPGMSKKQVLYVMGSPMLVDVFHQKRWDYLYTRQVDDGDREQKRISLFFENDILTGIQGDFRPDTQAPKVVKETTVDVPPRDLEKTMWEKVVWLVTDAPKTVIDVITGKEKPADKTAVTTTPTTTPAAESESSNTEKTKPETIFSVPIK